MDTGMDSLLRSRERDWLYCIMPHVAYCGISLLYSWSQFIFNETVLKVCSLVPPKWDKEYRRAQSIPSSPLALHPCILLRHRDVRTVYVSVQKLQKGHWQRGSYVTTAESSDGKTSKTCFIQCIWKQHP